MPGPLTYVFGSDGSNDAAATQNNDTGDGGVTAQGFQEADDSGETGGSGADAGHFGAMGPPAGEPEPYSSDMSIDDGGM